MTGDNVKQLPLEDIHKDAGAQVRRFRRLAYAADLPAGVMKEHLHTRGHVGLFDISHMKLFVVSGRRGGDAGAKACPIDAAALPGGNRNYSFFLNDQAGILDDLIVTRLGEDRVHGGRQRRECGRRRSARLRDIARHYNVVRRTARPRVSGDPGARGSGGSARKSRHRSVGGLVFMNGFEPKEGWFMSRSGYTGEDGFEIGLPEQDARDLLAKLLADERVMWIGLAARDSACGLRPASACTGRTSRRYDRPGESALHCGRSPRRCGRTATSSAPTRCAKRSPRPVQR
jgi:aminomethyltransferase